MKTTEVRKLDEKTFLRAKYGQDDGYFSITADLLRVNSYGGLTNVGGGCCHDDIREAFPELAELVAFHLCRDGVPMHYVANVTYWAELAAGVSEWQKTTTMPYGKSFVEVVTDYALCGPLGDAEEMTRKVELLGQTYATAGKETARRLFAEWLEGRLLRMKKAFDEAMKKHGV